MILIYYETFRLWHCAAIFRYKCSNLNLILNIYCLPIQTFHNNYLQTTYEMTDCDPLNLKHATHVSH